MLSLFCCQFQNLNDIILWRCSAPLSQNNNKMVVRPQFNGMATMCHRVNMFFLLSVVGHVWPKTPLVDSALLNIIMYTSHWVTKCCTYIVCVPYQFSQSCHNYRTIIIIIIVIAIIIAITIVTTITVSLDFDCLAQEANMYTYGHMDNAFALLYSPW